MKSKNTIFVVFLLIFLYFFAVYDINFHGADEPIYFAYTASVVEDGDLNVVNQSYPQSGQFNVSQTYNLPDFHNHGGVTLWVPFYSWAKFINFIATKFNLAGLSMYGFEKLAKCAMSFSTIVFSFFIILLTYFFCRNFFSNKIAICSIVAIFLGTPFFYYTLFEVANANIIACLFAILSIWFCCYSVNFKKLHWLLYGLFFSICVTIKTELWLQILFIIPFFITLTILKQVSFKNGIYFFVGFVPVLILRAINAYIKYGSIHMEEVLYFASIRYQPTYCFDGLLSSFRGIFYTSPVLYICMLGFIFILINIFKNIKILNQEEKRQDLFLSILTLYAIVKLFLVGKIFLPAGDGLSMRVLIAEFPVFVILYARALKGKKRYLQYFLGTASLFLIFWNLLVISEYITRLDWVYIAGIPEIMGRLSSSKYLLDSLCYIDNLDIKLKCCGSLIVVFLAASFYIIKRFTKSISPSFWYRRDQKWVAPLKLFSSFTIFLCAAYFVITILNVLNNKNNADKLKESGFFKDINIIEVSATKMTPFEEEQHLWTVFEMMRYYALKGKINAANYIRKFREEIFDKKECVYNLFYQSVKPYYFLANSYREKGRYKKAIECYEEIIRNNPDDTDVLISLGDVYITIGRYTKAIEVLEKAFQVKPNSINVCFRLADTYGRLGDSDRAAEYYQKCLYLFPNSAKACKNLGYIYADKGNYDKAIEFFQKFIQLNPNNGNVYRSLGHIYNEKGDYDKAIELFQKSIQLNPSNADAYCSLGYIYSEKSDYDKAIEFFQKFIQLNPNNTNVYYTLGYIYNVKGDTENALKQVIKLRELERGALADELEKSIRK
jgi:tetratricopeptide (TPR) repeat protein